VGPGFFVTGLRTGVRGEDAPDPESSPVTWEYRFITIAVRPTPAQTPSARGSGSRAEPSSPGASESRADQASRAAPRIPGISPSYQELEFPAQYGGGAPAAQAGNPLPRAKQVEQVVNRLAAEGWEYVALEVLLRDQVLVMRRKRQQTEAPEPQPPEPKRPWWQRYWRP